VKIEFHVVKIMKMEMISWKIYMIPEFYFDLVRFKEQMRIYEYFEFKLVDHHSWYKATSSLTTINLTMIFKLTTINLIVSSKCASV
jgi:hypothetical protein